MLDVLIIYEHKVREIETVLTIKYLLEKNGFIVEILCITDFNRFKYLYDKPRLVVVPSLYSTQSLKDQIGYICGNAKKVLNLQWEQVYNGKSNVSTRTPKEVAKEAVHVCWGQESYNRLKNAGIINAILVGAPQMDFLKSRFDSFYMSREELFHDFRIDSSKKVMLFISSFAYQSVTERQLERINNLVDWDAYKFRDITIKTRNTVLDWFERLLNEDDNIIIYRPHPSELDDDQLITFEKKYDNFKIIRDYSVKQWIKVSDVILNWYSTSGVEAYFGKKNCLYLRPIVLDENYDYAMYEKALKISTFKEFRYYTQNPSNIDLYYEKYSLKYDINRYYLVDNDYSCFKIAKVICDMLETETFDMKSDYVTCIETIKGQLVSLFKLFLDKTNDCLPLFSKRVLCKNKKIADFLREAEYRKKESISVKECIELSKIIEQCLK